MRARQAVEWARAHPTETQDGTLFAVIVLVGVIAVGWSARGIVPGLILASIVVGVVRRRRREALEEAQAAQVRAIQAQEIATYHQMTPRQFEEAVAYLCARDGCTGVRVVGGAGDLGADVIATTPDGRRLILQCKRYGPGTMVGSGDVQKVNGTYRDAHGGHLAAIVTTSRFTKPARDYATRVGIGRFDVDMLAGWASRTGPAPWH